MATRSEQTVSTDKTGGPEVPAAQTSNPDAEANTPWHFKVLLVALVFYLGFRLIQLIVIVGHWL